MDDPFAHLNLEQILDEDYEAEGGMTRREALARALIQQATEGRGNAAKELLAQSMAR